MTWYDKEKGEAREAAHPEKFKLTLYGISRQLFVVVGGYFFSLRACKIRPIRATTKVQNRKKSWYVIIGIPSFLCGLEGKPLRTWRASRLGSLVSRVPIIARDHKPHNLIFYRLTADLALQ